MSKDKATTLDTARVVPVEATTPDMRHHFGLRSPFCAIAMLNGMVLGSIGPCLPNFKRTTGLNDGQIATIIFEMRLCKLLGNFMWSRWATRRMRQRHLGLTAEPVRWPLALCLLIVLSCSLLIAFQPYGLALRASLASIGIAYGFSDSALVMLVYWHFDGAATNAEAANGQRRELAAINAAYTLGALIG